GRASIERPGATSEPRRQNACQTLTAIGCTRSVARSTAQARCTEPIGSAGRTTIEQYPSPMTRRPLFWIAYCALSLVALFVAARLFPLAIPLVNLDVKMERTQALAQGEALGKRYGLSPADARVAARFSHDGHTQNYVELEGGGKSAFADLT